MSRSRDEIIYRVHACQEVFDRISIAAAIVDDDARLQFCTSRLYQLTGFSSLELIGSLLIDVIDATDRDALSARVGATLRTGGSLVGFKHAIRPRDNERVMGGLDVGVLDEGAMCGAIVTVEDLTDRERAGRQRLLLESI